MANTWDELPDDWVDQVRYGYRGGRCNCRLVAELNASAYTENKQKKKDAMIIQVKENGKGTIFLNTDQIVRFEARNDFTQVTLSSGSRVDVEGTPAALLALIQSPTLAIENRVYEVTAEVTLPDDVPVPMPTLGGKVKK